MAIAALFGSLVSLSEFSRERTASVLASVGIYSWILGLTLLPGDPSFWAIVISLGIPVFLLLLIPGKVTRTLPAVAAALLAVFCIPASWACTHFLELRATSSITKFWAMMAVPIVPLAWLVYRGMRDRSSFAMGTGAALLLWFVCFLLMLIAIPQQSRIGEFWAIAAVLAGPLVSVVGRGEGPVQNTAAEGPIASPVPQWPHHPSGTGAFVFDEGIGRDALTGAHNRRHLDTVGAKLFRESLAGDKPASVLMLDIDHFKQVNDLYGHAAGDTVLQRFAHIIAEQVRGTDFVARYGGEEFVIILPSAPLAPAMRLAEKMRHAVQANEIEHAGKKLKITTSVGVTAAFPGDETEFAEVLARADKNLYRAKRQGRNRVMADPLPGEL